MSWPASLPLPTHAPALRRCAAPGVGGGAAFSPEVFRGSVAFCVGGASWLVVSRSFACAGCRRVRRRCGTLAGRVLAGVVRRWATRFVRCRGRVRRCRRSGRGCSGLFGLGWRGRRRRPGGSWLRSHASWRLAGTWRWAAGAGTRRAAMRRWCGMRCCGSSGRVGCRREAAVGCVGSSCLSRRPGAFYCGYGPYPAHTCWGAALPKATSQLSETPARPAQEAQNGRQGESRATPARIWTGAPARAGYRSGVPPLPRQVSASPSVGLGRGRGRTPKHDQGRVSPACSLRRQPAPWTTTAPAQEAQNG
jgi:hypothetical protein